MIWLAAAVLALCALAPAAWALRRRVQVRGRTESSVALYKAQIVELDRDLAERRIAPSEHATAMLELQRRLLAASEAVDRSQDASERAPLLLGLVVVPVLALGLYLIGGRPDLPAQPLSTRFAAADARMAQASVVAAQLRTVLPSLPPGSKEAVEAELLLGNVESNQGHFAAAAEAWSKALQQRFDPTLAVMVADATSRAEGRISPASAALFRQALAAAPADAPWRDEVRQQLANLPSAPAAPN